MNFLANSGAKREIFRTYCEEMVNSGSEIRKMTYVGGGLLPMAVVQVINH
ncbi:hypothetical protein C4J92_4441 [Pseudomonas sp. R3-18-08]|nr:hypothetical protein C4J92_4441 [Pseudomonas sp. R3-18-08]